MSSLTRCISLWLRRRHTAVRPDGPGLEEYAIGRHRILLPSDHALRDIQARWPRYDVALGEIARVVFTAYPNGAAIDIGANVGDTAALICKYQNVPVLCLEGNPRFSALLVDNARRIGPQVIVERCFVGVDGFSVNETTIHEAAGTASILGALGEPSASCPAKTERLATILDRHPRFKDARLVKLDTDGMDFTILLDSVDLLRAMRPVLFFEYCPDLGPDAYGTALEAMRALAQVGYGYFLIYDNFGHFLISLDGIGKFPELNAYLDSNRRSGRVIHYFDVCAFTAEDGALMREVKAFELTALRS